MRHDTGSPGSCSTFPVQQELDPEGAGSALSDGPVEDESDSLSLIVGSSLNFGAIYRPGVSKPDDVDDLPSAVELQDPTKAKGKRAVSAATGKLALKTKPATKARPTAPKPVKPKPAPRSTRASKLSVSSRPEQQKAKSTAKTVSHQENLDRLRRLADEFYASDKDVEGEEEESSDVEGSRKVTRSKRVINEGEHNLESDADDADVSVRVSRRLAEAYERASRHEDGDDELAYLKKAGVLLPNGFKQIPPFFSEEGEMFLSLFKGEPQAQSSSNMEDLVKEEVPKDCPICLKAVDKAYQCSKCKQSFCWLCFNEWLNNSATCPVCRDPKDIVEVPGGT